MSYACASAVFTIVMVVGMPAAYVGVLYGWFVLADLFGIPDASGRYDRSVALIWAPLGSAILGAILAAFAARLAVRRMEGRPAATRNSAASLPRLDPPAAPEAVLLSGHENLLRQLQQLTAEQSAADAEPRPEIRSLAAADWGEAKKVA